MKTFTVLTVSKRTGWENTALHSLSKQTAFKPSGHMNWVVVTENELNHLIYEFILNNVKIIDAPKTDKPSNLNASLNAGLREITTDYVIFYQDFIDLPTDCFEKLLELADEQTFVTTCTPNYDGSDDGRYTGADVPRPCRPEEWETNVAIAPMGLLRELGGFEEELDNGWSWDNVNVAQRAAMLGARFILDESNRPKLLPHEQTSKLALTLNGKLNDKLIRETREGKRPINVGYL